jgi:predicted transcriptional regulator
MTKLVAIQEAILRLTPQDWLDEAAEETPEMLAAIDEGLRSLEKNGVTPIDEVRKKIPQWASKSA